MIVHIADEAERDLEVIGDFIDRENPVRAIGFIRELRAKCLALGELPESFPLVPRYETLGVRHRVHGNYLIFYRVEPKKIADSTCCMAHAITGQYCFRPDSAGLVWIDLSDRCRPRSGP